MDNQSTKNIENKMSSEKYNIIDVCKKVARDLYQNDVHSARVDFLRYAKEANFDIGGMEMIFLMTCNDANSICEFITGFNLAPERIRNLNGKGPSAFINEFLEK